MGLCSDFWVSFCWLDVLQILYFKIKYLEALTNTCSNIEENGEENIGVNFRDFLRITPRNKFII